MRIVTFNKMKYFSIIIICIVVAFFVMCIKNKLKIGYQGVIFSNNYFAAKKFMDNLQQRDIELIPLVSSQNVIQSLVSKQIDYGVIAINNSIIGDIQESSIAIVNQPIVKYYTIEIPIIHSVFKSDAKVLDDSIKFVVSHEAALAQCFNNINNLYPNAKRISIENTALGPKYLKEGKIPYNSAVICPPMAGFQYNLFLDKENISDYKNNTTTFGIFKREN